MNSFHRIFISPPLSLRLISCSTPACVLASFSRSLLLTFCRTNGSINKNFAKLNGEELFLEPKTPKSRRDIAIPEFLYDDIQQYLSRIGEIEPDDRIFYFTKSALEKEIKRVANKTGLPPIRVHDLRHSHASMLIDMGFDILEISERLGHESVKTTLDTYSHLYPDKDKQLAERLNAYRRGIDNIYADHDKNEG